MIGRFISSSILLCSLLALGCNTTNIKDTEGPAALIGGASTFDIVDINGEDFSLSDHLGREVVILSFWSTWCEPCKAEMPTLQKLHDTWGDKGLRILSISLDGPETMSGVKPYIRSNAYTFQVAVDADTAVSQAYNPRSTLPFMVILNKAGQVHKKIEGFQLSEADHLLSEIKALVEEK